MNEQTTYRCVRCGDPIVGDDIDGRHTDDGTGEDVHAACCGCEVKNLSATCHWGATNGYVDCVPVQDEDRPHLCEVHGEIVAHQDLGAEAPEWAR